MTYEELLIENQELKKIIAELREEIAELKKIIYGRKSEKIPTIKKELGYKPSPAETQAKRKTAKQKRKELPVITIPCEIPQDEKVCPKCGGTSFKKVGDGKISLSKEYIPAKYIIHRYVRETLACSCGDYIVTAPVPPKPFPKSQYGAGFVAHMVTLKCSDSLPINRFAGQIKREGGDVSVSTMTDLFYKSSEVLEPLYEIIMKKIGESEIVQADETPIRTLNQKHRDKGYVWTFLNDKYTGYKFSLSRSSKTPLQVLEGNTGTLVVDAYSGYNKVTVPDSMERAGCFAHVRRMFYKALSNNSKAQDAIDLIRELYRVEHDALTKGIQRTPEHQQMREKRSSVILDSLKTFLEQEKDTEDPTNSLMKAIKYTLNSWESLKVFIKDAKIPIDNNASERALRKIALGRKNYLFVGSKQGGINLSILMTLVSSCEKQGINPEEYLKDVLLRIHTHPPELLEELLPEHWKPPQ